MESHWPQNQQPPLAGSYPLTLKGVWEFVTTLLTGASENEMNSLSVCQMLYHSILISNILGHKDSLTVSGHILRDGIQNGHLQLLVERGSQARVLATPVRWDPETQGSSHQRLWRLA